VSARIGRSATTRDVDFLGTLCAVLGSRIDRRLRGSAWTKPVAGRRLPGGRGRWLVGGGVVVVLVAGLLAWVLWPDGRPDPRSRVYTEATACLLTPAAGVVDKQAAPVWAGMQQASLATRGKVQYLEVDGPQTSAQAATYLATLARSKCDLILTVGDAQNAALGRAAASYPSMRFIAVGEAEARANVSVLDGSVPDRVAETVRTAVSAALQDVTAGD
jgi:hypothetical protein